MPDQRSLTSQLEVLIRHARREGLYDAEDFLQSVIEGPAPYGPRSDPPRSARTSDVRSGQNESNRT